MERPAGSVGRVRRWLYLLNFEAESTLSGLTVPVALFVAAMIFLGLNRPDYLRSGGYLGFQHFLGMSYVYFLFVFLFLFNKVVGQPLAQRGFATSLLLPFSKRAVLGGKLVVAWAVGFGIFGAILSLKWLLELPLLPGAAYVLELVFIGSQLFLLTSLWMLVAFAIRSLLPAILVEFVSGFALDMVLGALAAPFNQFSVAFGEPYLYPLVTARPVLSLPAAVVPFLVPLFGGATSLLVALAYFSCGMEVD